ncbi:MAG: esterase-like activity of phytase family protein [Candidatus Polarisedimenticolia bacterium]
MRRRAILLPAGALIAALAGAAPQPQQAPSPATSLWIDDPNDRARVRVEAVAGIAEPSDLLFVNGELYTISDSFRHLFLLRFDPQDGSLRPPERMAIPGLPNADLEALSRLASGEVLVASETDGTVFVLHPFPERVCAVWSTGVAGSCFFGEANCGMEAMAVLPDQRLFVAKERDPRGAWTLDLPSVACGPASLTGRTYLTLPEETGPDIGAATLDPVTGHLLIVARSRQAVLELEVPPATPGDTSPRPLRLLGRFSYARTEDLLDYAGLDFHQVEGIAIDARRTLYLAVDGNNRQSRYLGGKKGALLRFFAPG